jgi:hypothetical protein
MLWSEVRCDVCGMRGPGIRGRPRGTAVRALARDLGWNRPVFQAVERDVCPYCAKEKNRELEKHFARNPGSYLDEWDGSGPSG